MMRTVVLTALCLLGAACTLEPAQPPEQVARATVPEYPSDPPRPSPPPPGRDATGQMRYCGAGFAIDVRDGEYIHLREVKVGNSLGLYSTTEYPGVTLVTQEGRIGVHPLGESDWAFAHIRMAYREYLAAESERLRIAGPGTVDRVTLHYEESGTNSGFRHAYITSATDARGPLALLSERFDGSDGDRSLLERITVGPEAGVGCG